MSRLFDRAGMSTTTTGTGTLTLGSALGSVSPNLAGFLSFAGVGVPDATDVSYLILDANNSWEVGHGTYSAAGTTLTRNVTKSSNANAAINLSGNAQVFITVRAEDLLQTDANGNVTQAVNITNSTASNSTTTGALQVTGGLGIQGDIHIGGELFLDAVKRVVFNTGGNSAQVGGVGGTRAEAVAANATLSLSLAGGTGVCIFRDETVGGVCLAVLSGSNGSASIIYQSGTNFTTTDPGAGGNAWFISTATLTNRYGATHSLSHATLANSGFTL